MHIRFNKIRFKNLLSTGNTFVEIDLSTNRQTLIVGDNGCGKSTLLEAISFVLFNKPYRNINKSQLINSINQRDMLVEIWFNIGSDEYQIRRGVKPNIFEIYKNNQILNQEADARDYQQFLEENIIRLQHKSFTQTVIMGTASFTPFMQLNAAARRAVVEDLLDLQIFTNMNTILKTKQNKNKTSLTQVENEISILKEKIKLQEQYIKQLSKDSRAQIDAIRDKIDNLEADNMNKKQGIDQHRKEMAQYVESTKSKEKLETKLSKLNNYRIQLENKKNRIEIEIDFFHNNEVCPTCKQDIVGDFRCTATQERTLLIEEIDSGLKQLAIEYAKAHNEFQSFVNSTNSIREYEHLIKLLQNDIDYNNRSILQYKKDIVNVEQSNIAIGSQEDLTTLQCELIQRESTYLNFCSERSVLETASILLKDSGIKSQIIKNYIPIINKFVNKYLEDMNFFVNFELDENFSEVIKSRHRDVFTYSSFSEGEKLRLNLALIFAWRAISKMRCSTTTNIIFFDEILDSSLDYSGIDTFFKILYDMGNECNVFVISHKTDVVDKFTNTLRVEKHRGFSRWVQ